MLTERQLEVVLSVVYEYIRSGMSVGSRTVSKNYLTGRSSATIRNEMADLEDMGFLKHTHTSSGRIPTTLGYRVYADAVLRRARNRRTNEWMAQQLSDSRQGIEGALATSSELLSKVSNYVGIAALTPLDTKCFRHVDFVRLSERNVLLLVVLDGGIVHKKLLNMPWDISQETLEELARYVNRLSGRSWTEVKEVLSSYMSDELRDYRDAYEQALGEIEQLLEGRRSVKVFTGSKRRLFDLPDFQDLGRIQALYSFIEEEKNMSELLENVTEDGLNVIIGEENIHPELRHTAVITATATAGNQRATVGIIGPERMDYERAISTIDSVLQSLAEEAE
ncbi:MAG: heat-inducible transcriptional repressor HrcA [Synergistaceae bacterium]|nr:heat-inducible transcriptional repressor HrcA [Synergistaceae bacterium]